MFCGVFFFNHFKFGILTLTRKFYGNIVNYYWAETRLDGQLRKDDNDDVK